MPLPHHCIEANIPSFTWKMGFSMGAVADLGAIRGHNRFTLSNGISGQSLAMRVIKTRPAAMGGEF
jgi:hypothetical protein